MTDLHDKASESTGPEIVLTSSLEDTESALIASSELIGCDELTEEGQFPEYGEFLEMRRESDGETVYWECSKALANVVVDAVEESEGETAIPGTLLDIDWVAKAPSGEWRYTLEIDPDESLMDSND